MLDRTIPFCNTIMKCSDYEYRNVELPDGFSVVSYQSGYEKEWAKLEYSVGDFGSVTEAEIYFVETCLQEPERSSDMDCLFRDVYNIPVMEKVIKERFKGKYPALKSIQTNFAHIGGPDGLHFQADAVAYCG